MKELEGVYPLYPVPSYKNGGIHIKKSKRGTFKAAAKKAGMGVQEYANQGIILCRRSNFFRDKR